MSLVKTTEEIKKYLSVDGSFRFNTILPYMTTAEAEVKEILGTNLYTQLATHYEENSDDAKLKSLLPYCQRPIVYFAFLKGIDLLNVSIGNTGIGVVSTSTLAPASKERVESLRSSILERAYDSLEILLEFLEKNISDYAAWKTSDAYAEQHQFLINTAKEFNSLYSIDRQRHTFLTLRPTMFDIEALFIAPLISNELLAELKVQNNKNEVSDNNKLILPHIKKATAYLTIANYRQDKTCLEKGKTYITSIGRILEANTDKFPLYLASKEESTDSYLDPYNSPDNKFAIFG